MIAVEIHRPLQRAFPEVLRGETHLIALAAEKVQVMTWVTAEKGPVLIPTEDEDRVHYLVKDTEEGVVQEILLTQTTGEKPQLIQTVCMDCFRMVASPKEQLFYLWLRHAVLLKLI